MGTATPSLDPVRTLVRATFNATAEHFDSAPLFFWDRFGTRTVEIARVRQGDRVLDVCCGTGASALPAARRAGAGGYVVGVDLAERLLLQATAKARRQELGNVAFVAGDLNRLGLADASMDAVICVFGLYFAQDLAAGLRELWRVIRPGGSLTITTWGERALEPGNRMYLDAVASERPDLDVRTALSWERINRPELLAGVFADAGAGVPAFVHETVVQKVTPDDFWVMVLGSGYRLLAELMGAQAATRVREALHARMLSEGVRHLVADVMYARAVKER